MTAVKIPEHVVEKIKALELMIELQEKELLQATTMNKLEKLPPIQYLIARVSNDARGDKEVLRSLTFAEVKLAILRS